MNTTRPIKLSTAVWKGLCSLAVLAYLVLLGHHECSVFFRKITPPHWTLHVLILAPAAVYPLLFYLIEVRDYFEDGSSEAFASIAKMWGPVWAAISALLIAQNLNFSRSTEWIVIYDPTGVLVFEGKSKVISSIF